MTRASMVTIPEMRLRDSASGRVLFNECSAAAQPARTYSLLAPDPWNWGRTPFPLFRLPRETVPSLHYGGFQR